MGLNGGRDDLGGEAGTRFGGVYTVGGVEVLGVGQFVKSPADVRQQSVVLPGRLPVCVGQSPAHFIVVPALGGKFGAALLVGPGGIEDRRCAARPDLFTELCHAGKEAFW